MMINNRYLNSILKSNTRGGMKVTALISNSGRVTIYSVRKNEEQMSFLNEYLMRFGLKAHFA